LFVGAHVNVLDTDSVNTTAECMWDFPKHCINTRWI